MNRPGVRIVVLSRRFPRQPLPTPRLRLTRSLPARPPRANCGAGFAAEDAKLQRKAEARRECEDAIFDLADDEAAPDKARDAAELAEEWLQSNFERLSVDEIRAKAAELRGLARG